jgi:hypothetical protein
MVRASMYISSIALLAAVLAVIATAITMQWQQEHRARATQLAQAGNLAVRGACRELLTRDGGSYLQLTWTGCIKS